MNAIILSNSTQTFFSTLVGTIGIGEALSAISTTAAQGASAILAPVGVLGALGGGLALWKHYQSPQALPADIQDRKALLVHLQSGRVKLNQVPLSCDDFEAVHAAIQSDPFEIRHAGANLRKDPRFRDLALNAAARYHNSITNNGSASFWSSIASSIQRFRCGSLMQYIPEFHGDFEIMREAALAEPSSIRYAKGDLYQNPLFRELVRSLILHDAFLLEHAGEFRNDYEIVGMATIIHPSTLGFASEALRQRPEYQHLLYIATQRTALIISDEVFRHAISIPDAIRLLHNNPNTTLEQELSRWSQEYKNAFPSKPFKEFSLTLEGEPKRLLTVFLQRLREVHDYTVGGKSRKNIIALVHKLLSKELQEGMIAILTQAETNCGDNVLVRLIDIEMMSHFYEPNLSDQEFRKLAIGAQRYERLKHHVLNHHAGGEELEKFLFILLQLKHSLDLPISALAMSHDLVGQVSPETLVRIEKEILSVSDEQLLSESSYWKNRMAALQKSKVEEIDVECGKMMNDLDEYFALEESEQKQFLNNNESLKAFFEYALKQGVKIEYMELCNFLMAEKGRAIANI